MKMTPNRPYLLRAFYDWIVDNNCTPYLVVDATLQGVRVPPQYVKDGQIVLNISPGAVGNLSLANDEVTFNARFGGSPFALRIPQYAVLAIYARENGAGTMFAPEEELAEHELDDELNAEPSAELSAVDGSATDDTVTGTVREAGPDDDKPKKGSHLRIVK